MLNGIADGEEPSGESLGALGEHLPRILFQQFVPYVDMLQLEGNDGAVARACEDREGDQRPVAAFDFRLRRHGVKNGANLRERRAEHLCRCAVATRERLSGALKYSASAYFMRARYSGSPANQTKNVFSIPRVEVIVEALHRLGYGVERGLVPSFHLPKKL